MEGVFLIPYLFGLIVLGFPILYLEIALGQFTGMDSIKCWDISPIFRGIGYSCVFISIFVGAYYNVLVAIFMQYLYYSWWRVMPWNSCNNSWNYNCSSGMESTQFFRRKILQTTDSIDDMGHNIGTQTGVYALAWILVFFSLIKSIKTAGKVAYVTAIFPYLMMTILLGRGVTLKGSKEGIKFYLYPDLSRLNQLSVWQKAATQIFYSLSTCTGGIITLASFNKHDNNFLRDTILVGTLNSLTSFYSGFAIFSATGHLAYLTNKSVSQVTMSGSELAFISYPSSISALPVAQLWATLFYLMMFFLGFGTMIGNTEGFITPLENLIPNLTPTKSIVIRAFLCFLSFILGLPLTYQGGFGYLDIYDDGTSGAYLWVGLFELVCLIYVYDFRNFSKEIELMIGVRVGYIWKAFFIVIAPVCSVLMLISNYQGYQPASEATTPRSRGIDIFITLLCILPIPIYAIGYAIYSYIHKINCLRPINERQEKTEL